MKWAKPFDRKAIPPGAKEAFWRALDGHEIRHIEWPAPVNMPNRGSIMFLPGRGDAYEKYFETFEHWRQKGWQVTAADWRGQAGSGRLGGDDVTGHIDDFSLWIADLAAFWSQWAQQRTGPLILAGHSMGGHLVLRAVAEKCAAPQPDGLILSTPMLGVHPQFVPLWAQWLVAKVMTLTGDLRRPAWKWSEKPGEVPKFRRALLTHDEDRYADELWWRETRPQLVMGPGSWGWVEAAMKSLRALNRPGKLESVTCPVFLLSASADKLVSPRANRRAAARLPNVEFVEFGAEAAHEILREVDPIRDRALAAIDAFLDRVAPIDEPQNGGHEQE